MIGKRKVYMVCDSHDERARTSGAWNIGVEFMGHCTGRILEEDGLEIGRHMSSSFGWLRRDLVSKLSSVDGVEVVDLIGQDVPERFREAQS